MSENETGCLFWVQNKTETLWRMMSVVVGAKIPSWEGLGVGSPTIGCPRQHLTLDILNFQHF
ncbi:hypothetical protein AY600_06310 [Phormidium willei BDU 130791]|nr:hypothetical protein AY600_06310 [Phormidium willei BDU 130791]